MFCDLPGGDVTVLLVLTSVEEKLFRGGFFGGLRGVGGPVSTSGRGKFAC